MKRIHAPDELSLLVLDPELILSLLNIGAQLRCLVQQTGLILLHFHRVM